jgi:nucleoid-associated protein YgaU
MKKIVVCVAVLFCLASVSSLSALSYDNNEFQQKSRAYTELATKAFDDGNYEAATDYAREAEENAALSVAFIQKMIARADSQNLLYKAHTRLTWAREKKAAKFFPGPFANATTLVATGDELFVSEDYSSAGESAQKALDELSIVSDVTPLPAFYKVQEWLINRDCLWNIAANPAVYGNPLLWDKLYEANKASLKQPKNPNLLMPDFIIVIPSIKGEFREGTYDPSIKYDSFKSQVK